jgi:hypothetical protein
MTNSIRSVRWFLCNSCASTALAAAAICASSAGAQAQTTQVPAASAPAAPAPEASSTPAPTGFLNSMSFAPSGWASTISLGAQLEGGFVLNTNHPSDGLNFGQLFTDKANQFQLNQILLTLQRPTDPKATGYDVGFKFQFLYGSDARYTHYLGEFNHAIDSRYQISINEADLSIHLPWLTSGGVDLKVGQYPTPIGYEVIDPSGNPFYSHSYIFNFGIPLVHTGGYFVTHVNPMIDIYLGGDSGVNTTFGGGDNNGSGALLTGFNLTLLGGNLTILALSHMGPENPTLAVPQAAGFWRFENDAVITYKASDKLTLTTELNYIRDDFFRADGYGAAQYASYALTDTLTLNGRAEIWRDNKGFYVGAFPGNLDFVNASLGLPATAITAPPTTYSEFTAGVTWKPAVGSPLGSFAIRPEVRYDHSLNGTKPFNSGRDAGALTFAADAIVGF